ncbi:hypothetical protein [Mycolicibacterium celeriflavum]|uniref:Uncharacterized protein n=1 Tax=Mycolicibacterium celeriflavum TaxID=1249101 RepID=A0A7I7RL49_MYCCF|nr:hypothetical protein [Mycolicibacterium celeriflavum]MCV7240485.1 hypothetical protein [Mycolicibacterium celeriflavum]BBY44605.1 hypothetical protein MCEL_29000 [Mycolicibacterium celeriflavum]
MGALIFFAGVFIVAFHPYWRSAAVIISLFGWFVLLWDEPNGRKSLPALLLTAHLG